MAVTDQHPQYSAAKASWQLMQDASSVAGEDTIKLATIKYLPKSAGMIEAERIGDSMGGIYKGYLCRAQYPLWVQDSLRTMIGLVSKLNPEIKIESPLLSHLVENATNDGFGLTQLHIRIVDQVLRFGRCGIYVDVDAQGKPYFALYDALSIINWKEGSVDGRKDLKLVVLEEQHNNGEDEFSHSTETAYRALKINSDDDLVVDLHKGSLIEDKTPTIGINKLAYIPFVFVGAIDNSPGVGTIPLLTMAKSAIKSYQLSADYFQSLHHTAHPQPWISGLNKDDEISVTGVMAAWLLPKEASCGYLEVNGVGIDKTKAEMDAQKSAALEAGAKVIDTGSQESGEARKARQDDQHASLHSIVTCAAEAIQQAIKYAAQWLNLNADDFVFTIKPDFSNNAYDINLAKQLFEGAIQGRNSFQSYWEYLATGKMPERKYDDELALIESELDKTPLPRYRPDGIDDE